MKEMMDSAVREGVGGGGVEGDGAQQRRREGGRGGDRVQDAQPSASGRWPAFGSRVRGQQGAQLVEDEENVAPSGGP